MKLIDIKDSDQRLYLRQIAALIRNMLVAPFIKEFLVDIIKKEYFDLLLAKLGELQKDKKLDQDE